MVLSYSSAAQPTADTPRIISIATSSSSPTPLALPSTTSTPSSSTQPLPSSPAQTVISTQPPPPNTTPTPASSSTQITHLILDAGPLLSLTPLRHLAKSFHTTPQVVAELRDPKAREYFKNLGLNGVDIIIKHPKPEFLAKVIAFSKKTGDYAVLSMTDLGVVALTLEFEVEVNGEGGVRMEPYVGKKGGNGVGVGTGVGEGQGGEALPQGEDAGGDREEGEEGEEDASEDNEDGEEADEDEIEVAEVEAHDNEEMKGGPDEKDEDQSPHSIPDEIEAGPSTSLLPPSSAPPALDVDPESESDGGEWITPKNLSSHRNHDLGLLPSDTNSIATSAPLAAACMTGDFAVQNVLLGMGLGLVGEGGKRISKVKSFVLRCHACFKLCKDPSRKFCPSCGNPSLLRTTVTTSASTGTQRIHLKKNFQYHLRGTKFTIPDAKPGRAKGQEKGGSGLILREDQREWMDAAKMEKGRREKEERKLAKGVLGGWEDPDWLPDIISTGSTGKGRSNGPGGMPTVGHGRRNPNQARRKR